MWRSVNTPIRARGGSRVYTSDQNDWSAERVGGGADDSAAGGDVAGGDVEGGGWLSAASSVNTKRTSDCSSHSGV